MFGAVPVFAKTKMGSGLNVTCSDSSGPWPISCTLVHLTANSEKARTDICGVSDQEHCPFYSTEPPVGIEENKDENCDTEHHPLIKLHNSPPNCEWL